MADPLSIISVLVPSVKGPHMDEDTVREMIKKCPAVRRRFETHQIEDDFSKGYLSSMAQIYVALEENGMEDALSGITEEDVAEIDSTLYEDASSVAYLIKELPEIEKITREEVSEFNAGAVLAFVSVARHLTNVQDNLHVEEAAPEDEATPAKTPAHNEIEDEDEIDLNEAPKARPIAPSKSTSVPDIQDQIAALMDSGVPLKSIDIRPVISDNGEVSLSLSVALGRKPNIKDVIHLGQAAYNATKREIRLKSESPIVIEIDQ